MPSCSRDKVDQMHPKKIDGGSGFYLDPRTGKPCGGMWGTYMIAGQAVELWILIPIEKLTKKNAQSILRGNGRAGGRSPNPHR